MTQNHSLEIQGLEARLKQVEEMLGIIAAFNLTPLRSNYFSNSDQRGNVALAIKTRSADVRLEALGDLLAALKSQPVFEETMRSQGVLNRAACVEQVIDLKRAFSATAA